MAQQTQKPKSTAVDKRQEQAVAETPTNPIMALKGYIESRRNEIEQILPPGMDINRVVKTAMLAAMENPEIGEKCTAMSIYRSVLQASLMGLMVGDGRSHGYFIRYGQACTFRASYLGWAEVARRSEGVDLIRASVVYENDTFEMHEHPPSLKHSRNWSGDRGDIIGSVAVAYTTHDRPDGTKLHSMLDYAFVSSDELDQARKLADTGRASPAWKSWPDEMRKKVAVRRLCKWLPSNTELSRLTRIENNADNGLVDVPDPDIDNLEQIVDARFEEVTESPKAEPEVVKDTAKAKPAKPTQAEKLKAQMGKAKPKEAPAAPIEDDAPDYGGPVSGEMDF